MKISSFWVWLKMRGDLDLRILKCEGLERVFWNACQILSDGAGVMAHKCDLDVVIKLGGSAVTHKNAFETVNQASITAAAKLVKKIKGKCIVIHGAGSFGHFQAHEYGTAHGFTNDTLNSRIGFAKTRLSVKQLQHKITSEFVANDIPALGISTCGSWLTSGCKVSRSAVKPIVELLEAGFVPVLHGDCVLDDVQGCAILSGDKIIQRLVRELHPKRVVFLTDVDGIYGKPPEEEGATLLRRVYVKPDGQMAVTIATSSLKHDVTGGVREKLETASKIINISNKRTRVFVLNIMSEAAAYSACNEGILDGNGTEILAETPETCDEEI